jgi:hypothetical protein
LKKEINNENNKENKLNKNLNNVDIAKSIVVSNSYLIIQINNSLIRITQDKYRRNRNLKTIILQKIKIAI